MSTMISSKQMETKLYALVECLAANYGFDADEAFEFTRWETDVDHVGEILKVIDKNVTTEKPVNKKTVSKKDEPMKDDVSESPSDSTTSDLTEKIAVCRKNIELWQKKLSDGKSKDADKQRDKIDKEEKKLAKLLEKVPAPKVEPKKVEAKKEEKEKRIKRFSPVMAGQLKTALGSLKVEMTDKLKKEFQQYVEDLADDDFRKEGLADHMRAFAKLKAPEEISKAEEATEDTPAESEEESETVTTQDDSTVVDVTLVELQKISMTATVNTGTFWDADNGRLVKGPEADDDEDFEENVFEGMTYVVGEKTGRVYEARDGGDIFAGFIGVGKFKKMTK
jgi:hypothetical protein